MGYKVVIFDNIKESVMSSFMKHLVIEGAKLSLKVLANSVYGVMGYEHSNMYSSTCSASTTAMRKYCIKMAARFFRADALTVLYGDTDWCIVTRPGTEIKSSWRRPPHCKSFIRLTALEAVL